MTLPGQLKHNKDDTEKGDSRPLKTSAEPDIEYRCWLWRTEDWIILNGQPDSQTGERDGATTSGP